MARRYVFVDEAGNFDFSPKGSRYFILTSVTLDDCSIGEQLLALRRDLVWRGIDLTDAFHATADKQAVRDEVFALIARQDMRIDSTIFEKAKTHPRVQRADTFYELAWYLHMKHVAPRIATVHDELFIVGASIGTRKKQSLLAQAITGVIGRTALAPIVRSAYWPAATDPCLQVADYCCWAIQRKWEGGDPRSHVLIEEKIQTEFEVFRRASDLYY